MLAAFRFFRGVPSRFDQCREILVVVRNANARGPGSVDGSDPRILKATWAIRNVVIKTATFWKMPERDSRISHKLEERIRWLADWF